MKNLAFNIFTTISFANFIAAGLLLYINYTEGGVGMVMIYLMPLLVTGLLFGIGAFVLNKVQNLALNHFSTWIHYFNLLLTLIGAITLIYIFF